MIIIHNVTTYNRISELIESYSNLEILPFTIKVKFILTSFEDSLDENELYYDLLKSLINNTKDYIGLRTRDGGYLLWVDIKGERIRYAVDIEFK